ncbi:CYTH domain-containing protein [Actinobacillus genomosp. 2]|uniref:CYTH domain-containing protein n=1 Tax=Actinobacillus genomosp. 2 TaxID=230709 RepID=UPI002441430E|nr:CYTH domain-containing protein [Actinobacillus genomosp. 2]WGE32616.1 CYTH domain-containing protein [Actinobacillus genomosp. 2]
MENEIELKIMLTEDNAEFIKTWLSQQRIIQQDIDELGNTYFDTPTQFFAGQQIGLRVRSKNQCYEMTLKTKGEIIGGLHIRPEYNLPLASNQPDFKRLVSHFDLQIENVEQIAEQLRPTFSTDFVRHKWLIEFQQSQIEVALDNGVIKNEFGQAKICELEFELKQGSLADILQLLAEMPVRDGMWFSSLSKAQRGYLIGQTVKFEQEIAKAIQTKEGYELEQILADYIRTMPENKPVLSTFNECFLSEKHHNWLELQNHLKSQSYLIKNIAYLQGLYS